MEERGELELEGEGTIVVVTREEGKEGRGKDEDAVNR